MSFYFCFHISILMSSKAIRIKDLNKTSTIVKNEFSIRIRKHLIKHPNKTVKKASFNFMNKTNIGISQMKSRCIITGRPRGVLRSFKLSRIQIKQKASLGLLPGLRKSSW